VELRIPREVVSTELADHPISTQSQCEPYMIVCDDGST
jgi:hypothetical protein